MLPVEFITPEITKETLEYQLFRDTLASYTTYFNTNTENNYNRSINIRLAAESIDGTLLLPGEEFSFNKVVGPVLPREVIKLLTSLWPDRFRMVPAVGSASINHTLQCCFKS